MSSKKKKPKKKKPRRTSTRVLLAIDPGPEFSAYVIMERTGEIQQHENQCANESLLEIVRGAGVAEVACEGVQSYGMAVGKTTFETCFMIGRIQEATIARGLSFTMLMNPDIRLQLCKVPKAKDPNVRRALMDKYARTGGGANPEIGVKNQPGPLYGCAGEHFWSALAVGWAHIEINNKEKSDGK